jgi:hypothetical protein
MHIIIQIRTSIYLKGGTNMVNINCSEQCIYEQNGKCTLNHVTPILNISSNNKNCGYFVKKKAYNEAPSKS